MLALAAVVVAVIPLVKGTLVAEETPENATGWVVAVGLGVAVVLEGLSTLFISSASFGLPRTDDLLVDDVHDAVGYYDVGDGDFGAVDEDFIVFCFYVYALAH